MSGGDVQPSVLLVDDEEENLECLCLHFRKEGFRTFTAQAAEPAIQVAGRSRPDAIVLDYGLPGMNGLAAVRKLKSAPKTAHIPIMMLTAVADGRVEVDCLKNGADGYLTKGSHAWESIPFHVMRLIDRNRWGTGTQCVTIGELTWDPRREQVFVRGVPVPLTPREYCLFQCVASRSPDPVAWRDIQRECWHTPEARLTDKSCGSIDTMVSHLKKKLGQEFGSFLVSRRGLGLQLRLP